MPDEKNQNVSGFRPGPLQYAGYRRAGDSRLQSAGILPYFKGVFISQEVGADKPSRSFFQACFDSIPDFDPAAALMVGDSLTSDIRGGRDAGLRTCWFNPQGEPPDPEVLPDWTVGALEELPALLETL